MGKELKKVDDGDGLIVWDELTELMADPASVEVLTDLGVDVNYLGELQSMTFDAPGVEVAIEKVMEQMLKCRQDLPATVKHLVDGQALTHWVLGNKITEQQ